MKRNESSPQFETTLQHPPELDRFDPEGKNAWALAPSKKLEWFRAVQGQLATICMQRGIVFDAELFILGEVFNSINDDENTLQMLEMHFALQGDTAIVDKYAEQSKTEILMRLQGHLAQSEIPQELRSRLLDLVAVIELSNFFVAAEFRAAHAAFRSLKAWVNNQTECKLAMKYDYTLSEAMISNCWYSSFKLD